MSGSGSSSRTAHRSPDKYSNRSGNEAESYVDLGHRMLEHDKDGPYWVIMTCGMPAVTCAPSPIDPKNKGSAARLAMPCVR